MEHDSDEMSEKRAQRITEALGVLRENVLVGEREYGRGAIATVLVTQAMRQCLLAMAEAMEPAERGEPIEGVHLEVVILARRTLMDLDPIFVRTLPADGEAQAAFKAIAEAIANDPDTWVNTTAGILCDHRTDTPAQREQAARDVLSLLFFHPGPNPWAAAPGAMNGDALEHVTKQSH